MEKLRQVDKYSLNKGSLTAEGLYNVTNAVLIDSTWKRGASLWFSEETKDELLKMSDYDFMVQCAIMIKTADEQLTTIERVNAEVMFAKNVCNVDIGQVSDGYHTFRELYEFRKMYNAALFNEWAKVYGLGVHKSKRHFDGELCFGGSWFIVVAELPTGQISNHYKSEDWDLFKIPQYEKAKIEFDGHTGKDVLDRIKAFITTR